MNQITIAGHLGADPEVRFTSSGQKVTTLRVAARVRKSSKGDETIWWRVTIWGEQFDKMIPYFKKGSPIIVFGELTKPEIFTDRDGKSQVSMNITANHLLFSPFGRPDGAGSESGEGGHEMAYAGGASQANTHQNSSHGGSSQKEHGRGKLESDFNDDEIPF